MYFTEELSVQQDVGVNYRVGRCCADRRTGGQRRRRMSFEGGGDGVPKHPGPDVVATPVTGLSRSGTAGLHGIMTGTPGDDGHGYLDSSR